MSATTRLRPVVLGPVVLRPAGLGDASFLCSVVADLGGSLPRAGAVDPTDPHRVIDAVWHDAAAVFVAEWHGRPAAMVTLYDLHLLHRTVWLEVLTREDCPVDLIDRAAMLGLEHARRSWAVRAVRTLDPVGRVPLLAGFSGNVGYEGEIPGRCPGCTPDVGEVRAVWDDEIDRVINEGKVGNVD